MFRPLNKSLHKYISLVDQENKNSVNQSEINTKTKDFNFKNIKIPLTTDLNKWPNLSLSSQGRSAFAHFISKNGKISLYISIHKSNKYETNQVC